MSNPSFTFAAGGTVRAEEMNTNFSELHARLGTLTNEDLDADAGIGSEQLTDRFGVFTIGVQLVPRYTDAGVVSDWIVPDSGSGVEVWKQYLALPASKRTYLYAVSFEILSVTPGGGGEKPTWWVYYNGILLGGGNPSNVNVSGVYWLKNTNASESPLASVADGGYLLIKVGRTAAGGADPKWSGVFVQFYFKSELAA